MDCPARLALSNHRNNQFAAFPFSTLPCGTIDLNRVPFATKLPRNEMIFLTDQISLYSEWVSKIKKNGGMKSELANTIGRIAECVAFRHVFVDFGESSNPQDMSKTV
jgi:hypothetical protein